MKLIVLIIPLIFISCSSPDKQAVWNHVKSAKTVLVVPFSADLELKKEIVAESEEKFRKALVENNFRIIGKEKLNKILKEKEFASSGINPGNIKRIGKSLGADFVITGRITEHSEYQKDSRDYSTFIYGSQLFSGDSDKVYEIKAIPYLKFQMVVTLFDISGTAETITINNPDEEGEKKISEPDFSSLDSFRNMVLNKMAEELIKNMNQ